ncbi:MAG: hypothetical protein HY567_00040 [Candidatus Kerfeldbacteria bacterium]|nr:hypothetical protein [Candidatus Kerfeldbacteria bacterium]
MRVRGLFGCIASGVVLIVLLCASADPAKAAPAQSKRYEFSLAIRQSAEFFVSDFPLAIRSVPRHRDDDYLAGNPFIDDPLPDTLLRLHRPSVLDFSLSYLVNPHTAVGISAALISNPNAKIDSDQRYQQNQWGDARRIEGASLRFYQLTTSWFQVGLTGSVLSPRQHIADSWYYRGRIGGVVDLTGVQLVAEGGWDRWGSDQSWRKQNLGRLREHRLFARLEAGVLTEPSKPQASSSIAVFVEAGASRYSFALRPDSRDLQYRRSQAPVLSGGATISF